MRLIDADETIKAIEEVTIKAIEEVRKIMNEEIKENDRKDLINFVNGLNQKNRWRDFKFLSALWSRNERIRTMNKEQFEKELDEKLASLKEAVEAVGVDRVKRYYLGVEE